MQYILIPEIKVQRINIRQGSWLASPLPIMATHLFAHALGRDTGIFPDAHAHIHHEHRYNVEALLDKTRVSYHNQESKVSGMVRTCQDPPASTPGQPIMTGDITLSLILRYPDSAPNPKVLEQALLRRRIGGGLILNHRPIVTSSELHGKAGILQKVPYGFATIERTHLLEEGPNRIETLHHLVRRKYIKNETNKEPCKHYAPCALGYSTITDIALRKNTRGNYPHAFCDTLIGLVELKAITKLEPTDSIFWKGSWQETRQLQSYLVQTQN